MTSEKRCLTDPPSEPQSGRLVAPRTVSPEGWPRPARPAELHSVESIWG